MKTTQSKLALTIAVTLLLAGARSLPAQGTAFTYQGRLTGKSAPASGNYEMRFALFDAGSGGSQVGASQTNAPVAVTNGLFTVMLNFGTGIFTGAPRWLEIGVRTNGTVAFHTLGSRQQLTPSPYSIFAGQSAAVNWGGITAMPSGFADGVDNDTTYSAGAGLSLNGTQFSVSFGGTGAATTASRTDHNHVGQSWFTWTNLSGIPASVSNGYTAGAGLLLTGNQFSVSFGGTGVATNASRIDHNHVGQSWLTWTNISGIPSSVSNGYVAGAGLTLTGNQFAVSFATNGVATNVARGDHNHVNQPWFTWTNLAGIPSSVSNGYTAGAGLLLAGNQFSVSFGGSGAATTASRTDHNHVGASWLTWTNISGIPSSVSNGYVAGAGLTLTGNQFAVSFATNGVATNVARGDHNHVGQSWFSWTNLANIPAGFADNVDNDTLYSAGTGLTLAGTQFNLLFSGTGVATSAARGDHNHVGDPWLNWTNLAGIPASVSNGYTAGAGLLLAGNQFSVSFGGTGVATTASRIDHNHVGQSWLTWTNISGIPSSVSNGYVAGAGLTLSNNQFAVSFATNGVATNVARGDHNHLGQAWFSWVNLANIPAGFADNVDNDTLYSAGTGLTLVGTQFNLVFSGTGVASSAARGDHNHVGDPWLTWTNISGIPSSVSNGYTAGAGLLLAGNQFSVSFGGTGAATTASRTDHNHVGASWLTWTNISGIPSSVSNGYTAGAGLTLSNNQFSVSFATNGVATNVARGDHNHIGQSWFSWLNLSNIPAGFADNVDNDTLYSAGTGLTLAGTQFNVTYGGTGVSNSAARTDHNHIAQPWFNWTNLAGIPSIVSNVYTAGAGLALTNNQFSVRFGSSGVATNVSRSDHDHQGQNWAGTNYDGLSLSTVASNGNGLHAVANIGGLAYGVFGEAFDGYGVVGSGGTFGLYGYSSNGIAVWGESSGGIFAPQIEALQDNTNDVCRIRLGVTYSPQWDIVVGNGNTPGMTFFNGLSNVMTLDYFGNLCAKSFNPCSDRNVKQDFDAVDGRTILARLAALPIQTWKFKDDQQIRHIGPMAQDFYAAFNVGPDDKHIATVDADGVALAAIQGLNEVVREKEARIEALERSVAELKAMVTALAGKPTADHQ